MKARSGSARRARLAICLLVVMLAALSCSHKARAPGGYKPGAVPGISHGRVLALLGKPQQDGPFSLPGVQAQVMTYGFGQVLLQDGVVVAVSINDVALTLALR